MTKEFKNTQMKQTDEITEYTVNSTQYTVTQTTNVIEGLEVTEYGIMQFTVSNGEMKKLAEVRGISSVMEDVVKLVDILSQNDVEPSSLYEVVEDYTIEQAMVSGCR